MAWAFPLLGESVCPGRPIKEGSTRRAVPRSTQQSLCPGLDCLNDFVEPLAVAPTNGGHLLVLKREKAFVTLKSVHLPQPPLFAARQDDDGATVDGFPYKGEAVVL